MKYDVFISYSRLDYKDEKGNVIPDNVVSKVKDALTSAGVTYWFDEDGIHHGDDFAEKIVANIEESDIFIYLSTENANKSPWTRKEIACAYELEKKIIPVRIDNSRYDRSVMLRISDLDYIDYMKNPEKGMQELLKEVAYYIKNKRDEENKREEEIERKRILEEKEIEEIELLIKKLQAEELSVEVARDDLLLRIQRINNDEKRNHLQSLVESTSPGIIKNREKDNSISELKKENQKLKDKLDNMPDVGIMPDKLKKRHISIVIVLSVLLLSSVVELIFTSKSISENDKIKILENYKEGNEHDSINNIINGHEYVDLGLPSGLKWATCNVGANKPEEDGCYYAWGETKTKEVYDTVTSLTYGKKLGDFSGVERYDAATANWGSSWRMPTSSEFQELIDNCTWTFTSIGGNAGFLVTGKNGNSIFLPASGSHNGQSKATKNGKGNYGRYWSSTPYDIYSAYGLYFSSGFEYVNWGYRRSNGLTVRPITE
ncbi:MAG: TIR domain-containing protein [Bacteroidales bacterium]|nr:TIR domain-containing protein [Bacteroidales bacterium]